MTGGKSTDAQASSIRKTLLFQYEGKQARSSKDKLILGSVVSADLRLAGEGVSPVHAVIERQGETLTIYDLASETGVFVNGKKVIAQVLNASDEIGIGHHKIRLSFEDADATPSMQSPNPGRPYAGAAIEANWESGESVYSQGIFDYSPCSQSALEVVMSWKGMILDFQHFREESAITVGSSQKADFIIPPWLASPLFPWIEKKGADWVLHFESPMKGVIQRKGELLLLDRLPSRFVTLMEQDFAKVTVGEVDFYLSFTAAPPKLKRRKVVEKDPLFFKVFFLSLGFSLLALLGVINAHVPEPVITPEQLPARIATILYQPEKYTYTYQPPTPHEEPKAPAKLPQPKKPAPVKLNLTPRPNPAPKPVPKEMNASGEARNKSAGVAASTQPKRSDRAQNAAREGQGARAKGAEGTRGRPNARPGQQPQDAARRPSPQAGPGRGAGQSQKPGEGNVDLLKSATDQIQNLLGNTAMKLGQGGERLKGFGGFDTQGQGGLALSGSGPGGGGSANSLGGLSNQGRGGGRVGTGLGAAGTGYGIIGGQSRVVIRSGGPEETVVMGSIDADAVEAALLAHRDEFRLCYEREINAETPNLAGRVTTNFVIGPSGIVNQAGIDSTTLKHPPTERCVLAVIKRIQFPIPRGGGIVQVTYPFKFTYTPSR